MLSVKRQSQVSTLSNYIEVSSVRNGGDCRLYTGNKAMIPTIWHRVAKLVTVSILEDLGLWRSLLYHTIIVPGFGVSSFSHVHGATVH